MNIHEQDSGKECEVAPVRPFSISITEAPLEGAGDVQSGNLTWRTLISADRTPSNEMVLGIADFPPHGTLNVHRHAPAEFYLGLSGDGTVLADGLSLRIAQGVAVFIPGNIDHGVIAGARGLSIAYGFARGSFEGVIYDFRDGTEPHNLVR